MRGGPQVWLNSWVHACCQGQFPGRCSVSRRAEDATRAGTAISVRRMVLVVALVSAPPARLAAGSVIAMVPCVVLFIALQRYYVAGLSAGAVKG